MCTGTHPYIPAIDVVEARLLFETPGGKAENVLNFQAGPGQAGLVLHALGVALKDWWHGHYAALVAAGDKLLSITLTDLTTESGAQEVFSDGLPENGQAGGSGLPDNVTLAVKHQTASRGKSFRGRTYIPGMTTVMLASNDVATDLYVSNAQEVFDELLTGAFTAIPVVFSIVSRCHNNVWRTTAVVTAVTNNTVEPNIDSMRRRLKGRGI